MVDADEPLAVGLSHQIIIAQLPPDNVCMRTLAIACNALPEPIFNHSLRVYLLAKWLAAKEKIVFDKVLLFMACICHDLGVGDLYNGEQRFEVEGADAARRILRQNQFGESDCHKVWTAIALHTSAGIAERIDAFTRLVRIAVKMDFSYEVRDLHEAKAYAESIEVLLPRLDVEKSLADAVVSQARKIPENVSSTIWPDSQKHPKASWPGILLRAHIENPGWEGVNHAF